MAVVAKTVVCKRHPRIGRRAERSCSADVAKQCESPRFELIAIDCVWGGYSDFVWVDPVRLVAKKGEGEWMQFHGWRGR